MSPDIKKNLQHNVDTHCVTKTVSQIFVSLTIIILSKIYIFMEPFLCDETLNVSLKKLSFVCKNTNFIKTSVCQYFER